MEKLSQILWRERELLDTVLFKLEEQNLMLTGGRTRWLVRTADELEEVLGRIRRAEVLRSVAADEVAASIGLGPDPSLRELADVVDEPWHMILLDHLEAFTACTRELVALAAENRRLVGTPRAFDVSPSSSRAGVASAERQMRDIAARATLAATARVTQPSLQNFLR